MSPSIHGTPMFAFDKHTRVGKQAISIFARENADLRDVLEHYLPEYRSCDAACMADFYAGAVPVARRLSWSKSAALETLGMEAEMIKVGVPPHGVQPLIEAVRRNLDHLNEIRARTPFGPSAGGCSVHPCR